MKGLIKILAIFAVTLGFAASSYGQVSANATASANIVTPIAIVKDVDMNFGNVAVQSGTGGTVVLAPGGGRSESGGVTLPSTTGTVTAASFTVSGMANYTYGITLPSANVVISDGTNTMNVNSFTSTPTPTGTLDGTTGSQTLNVGATLNVAAGQPAGAYTLTDGITVTVNYN